MSNSTTPAAVFLVDDHPVVRMGLRHLFDQFDHLSVVGEAERGEEALSKISEVEPDLAIVDISLDGMDGIELTRQLVTDQSQVRVLIVSMHDDAYYVEQALDAGARGYVLKDKVNRVLLEAVETVLDGGRYLGTGHEQNV